LVFWIRKTDAVSEGFSEYYFTLPDNPKFKRNFNSRLIFAGLRESFFQCCALSE